MMTAHRSNTYAWAFLASAVVAAATLFWITKDRQPQETEYAKALRSYRSGEVDSAKSTFESFVEGNKTASSRETQDQVTSARLHLAYLDAKDKDFAGAARQFKEAASEHKGTDAVEPGYGTMTDQAEYQAAVCLASAGKTKEALSAFRAFIKERPTSGLIHAAHRRITLLTGKQTEDDAALLQAAVTKQEEIAKVELAMCGPKAAAFLVKKISQKEADYHDIAKAAQADESGTTMQGLKQALKANGIDLVGLELSRRALNKLKLPAIWLTDQHYVVLTTVYANEAEVWDPLVSNYRRIPLPKLEDVQFKANVLALEAPGTENQS